MPKYTQPVTARSSRPGAMRPGVHVAPFLSREGRLVLLAIGRREKYLHIAVEVMEMKGSAEGGFTDWSLRPYEGQGGQIPFLNPNNGGLGQYARRVLWPRGVHLAPWVVSGGEEYDNENAQVLVAVDSRHRLVAEMHVPPGVDPNTVRLDLEAVLDSVDPAGTTDDATVTT